MRNLGRNALSPPARRNGLTRTIWQWTHSIGSDAANGSEPVSIWPRARGAQCGLCGRRGEVRMVTGYPLLAWMNVNSDASRDDRRALCAPRGQCAGTGFKSLRLPDWRRSNRSQRRTGTGSTRTWAPLATAFRKIPVRDVSRPTRCALEENRLSCSLPRVSPRDESRGGVCRLDRP